MPLRESLSLEYMLMGMNYPCIAEGNWQSGALGGGSEWVWAAERRITVGHVHVCAFKSLQRCHLFNKENDWKDFTLSSYLVTTPISSQLITLLSGIFF